MTNTNTHAALSLGQNSAWSIGGYALYTACQWGMIVVLAKLGMIAQVGQFTLGLAVTAPVVMFANLQLRAIQATDAKAEFSFAEYLTLRLSTATAALLLIAMLVAVIDWNAETRLIILLIGVAKTFESVSDVFWGRMQLRERMDWVAQSMVIRGAFSLLALGGIVAATRNLIAGISAMAAIWLLTLVLYDIPRTKRLLSRQQDQQRGLTLPSRKVITRLLVLSFPLGLVTALESMNFNVPRYAVEHYWGEAGLGIFAAIAYTQIGAIIVVRGFGQSASPRLATSWHRGDMMGFRDLIAKLTAISIITGIAGLLIVGFLGRELLVLFYSEAYADHADVFFLLIAGAMFINIGSSCLYAITAARYFRAQVYIFGATVLCTLLASLWLIPLYALKGAAFAVLLSSILHAMLGFIVVARIYHQKVRQQSRAYCDLPEIGAGHVFNKAE